MPDDTGDNADAADPAVLVTLVHGTWASHAPWCQPGSKLRQRIESRLEAPVAFHPFNWTDRNRHRARLLASARLAKHILRLKAAYPDARQLAIGRSHGGNVIRYAMRHPGVAEALDGVATLATPHISARPRPFSTFLTRFVSALAMEAALFSIVLIVGLLIYIIYLMSGGSSSSNWLMRILGSAMGVNLIIFPLAVFLFGGLRNLYIAPIARYLVDLQRRLIFRQAALVTQIDPPGIEGVQLLSMAVRGDEPNLAMRAAGAPAQWLFAAFANTFIQIVAVVAVLPYCAMVFISWMFDFEMSSAEGLGLLLLYAIGLFIVVGILPLFVLAYLTMTLAVPRLLHAPAFGEEGFMENWFV